ECIRKPHFLPTWLEPIAWLLFGREVERTRRSRRVAWPTDGAAGEAVGPFDAPADADVTLRAFAGWAGPDVVPRRCPAAVVVFKDVEVDAIRVRKAGTWIRPRAGQNAVGRAEPVAERVEVMDAHNERGQRVELLCS